MFLVLSLSIYIYILVFTNKKKEKKVVTQNSLQILLLLKVISFVTQNPFRNAYLNCTNLLDFQMNKLSF